MSLVQIDVGVRTNANSNEQKIFKKSDTDCDQTDNNLNNQGILRQIIENKENKYLIAIGEALGQVKELARRERATSQTRNGSRSVPGLHRSMFCAALLIASWSRPMEGSQRCLEGRKGAPAPHLVTLRPITMGICGPHGNLPGLRAVIGRGISLIAAFK